MSSGGWSKEFLARYAMGPNVWQCEQCLTRNKKSAPKCISCEHPNKNVASGGNGAATTQPAAGSAGGISFGFGGAPTTGTQEKSGASSVGGFTFGSGGKSTAGPASGGGGFAFSFGNTGAAKAPTKGFNFSFNTAGTKTEERKSDPGIAPAEDDEEEGETEALLPPPSASVKPLRLPLTEHPFHTLPTAESRSEPWRRLGETGGHLWVWGSGECEQLGFGEDVPEQFEPALLPSLSSKRIVRLAVGGLHTLALTMDGSVWSWGCNDDAVLGREGAEGIPALVPELGPAAGCPIVQITSGDCHSAALAEDGRVFVWGTYKGGEGHLGFASSVEQQRKPALLDGMSKRYGKPVSISSGAHHTALLTDRGELLTWGTGEQGQLCRPAGFAKLRTARPTLRAAPVRLTERRVVHTDTGDDDERRRRAVRRKVRVANVFCGSFSTFVLSSSGKLYAAGLNNYGQLGVGDAESRTEPAEVQGLPEDSGVVQVVCGMHHSLFLVADGRVFACGRGDTGQLGLAAERHARVPVGSRVHTPRQIPAQRFGRDPVVQIAANGGLSMAVTESGRTYTWGFGDVGQLGNDPDEDGDEAIPFCVSARHPSTFGAHSCVQVGAGGQHTVALLRPTKGSPPAASSGDVQTPASHAVAPSSANADATAGASAPPRKRARRG